MNVTLIGMSGAGKSHIGRKLAKKLGYTFLDVDRDLWEIKYGKPIQKILDEKGEKWYVKEEEALTIEATKGKDNLVISPPGSVAYQPAALRHLKEISKVIYLKVPFLHIEERNKRMPPHAVVGLKNKSLKELYNERTPVYEQYADFVLETEHRSVDESLQAIMDFLNAWRRRRDR